MHKILLVDDMRRFLDLTQSFLSRAECRLLTASTGLEAIKVAKTEKPDLIVLDIEMPEMNGIEACRIIKSDTALSKTPIIMLTSLSKEEEARRAGANHYLKKPIDEETFLSEIARFLPIILRQEQRFRVDLEALASADGRTSRVALTDISRSGGFVTALPYTPTIADQMTLRVTLPLYEGDRQIEMRAVVVRVIPDRGVGVRFLDLTSGAKLYIDDYLEKLVGAEKLAR
jgi:CheY-like chemotaxis protein